MDNDLSLSIDYSERMTLKHKQVIIGYHELLL